MDKKKQPAKQENVGAGAGISGNKQEADVLRVSERRLREVLENSIDASYRRNLQTNAYEYLSPTFTRISGYTPEEMNTWPLETFLNLMRPDDLAEIIRVMTEAVSDSDDTTYQMDYRFKHKDGQYRWFHDQFTVMRDSARQAVALIGSVSDITERKQAEVALKESEERFRNMASLLPQVVFETDEKGNFTFANRRGFEIFGYSEEDVAAGLSVLETLIPQDRDRAVENISRHIRGESFPSQEYTAVRKDGSKFPVEIYAAPIIINSKYAGMRGIMIDLTDRKQAEVKLKQSEAQYRLLAEHTTDIVWLMDMDIKTTYESPSGEKLRGFTFQEIKELPIEKNLTPESLKLVLEAFFREIPRIKADAGYNPVISLDLEFYRKDGTTFWLESNFSVIRDDNGEPVSMLGEGRDISDRKMAQEEANKLSALVRHAAEMITMASAEDGRVVFINRAGADILGIEPEDMGQHNLMEFVPDHLKEKVVGEVLPTQRGGRWEGDLQFRNIRTGRLTDVHSTLFTVNDEATNQPLFLANISMDITKRKQIEEERKRSVTQYSLLAENTTDFVWLMDMNLNKIYASPSVIKRTGFTEQETMELPLERHVTPDSFKVAIEMALEFLHRLEVDTQCNPTTTFDMEYCCKDGTTFWAENKFSVVRNSDGKPISILGEARDITERKQAEEALRESEELYHTLLDDALNPILIVDENGTYLDANTAALEFLECSREDLLGMKVWDFSPPSLLPRQRKEHELFTRPRTVETEYLVHGTIKTLLLNVVNRKVKGKTFLYGIGQDITDRRLSEEKLLKSYESVKKTLNDAINTMVKIVELRDPYTAGHQQKVADLATAIAREMKLEATRIDQLKTAAMIHDIGKMYVPSDILSKPGKLSAIELGLIKTHSKSGYDIVKGMDFPATVALAVLQHHERLDGSGYPDGIKGEDMLLEAKILVVADVVEAMASHRPYRPAMGIDKALEEISKNKGKLYDPDVVDACLALFNSGRFEFKSV